MKETTDFKEQLKIGNDGERQVAEAFTRKLNLSNLNYHDTKDGDFSFEQKGRVYLVEVKKDKRASETGNIVIEFESRGKKSGIETTKADIWVIITSADEAIVVKTSDLKNWIKDGVYDCIKHGGDRDSSKLYLFKTEIIKMFGTVLKLS